MGQNVELQKLLDEYGLSLGIAVWLVIGLVHLLKNQIPELVGFWKERFTDEQEFRQTEGSKDADIRRLEYLSAMGSRNFTEEQLTQLTSETQTQLAEANEFIRKAVAGDLDLANQNIQVLKEMASKVPEETYDKLRDDLRNIAENWKLATIEYRHLQTKMTIIINILEELNQHE